MSAVLKAVDLYRTTYAGCPLCEGDGAVLRTETCEPRGKIRGALTWMKCGTCAHVYTESYFNASGQAELLKCVNEDGFFGGKLDEQRLIWGAVIQRLLTHAGRQGKWIDIGCGNGGFVFTAAEHGLDAVGIDTRPYILDALRIFGYSVEWALAEDYDYSGASVVVMADVLEHIPYPKELLTRIRQKLTGALYVSCPNMDSMSWRYLETVGGPVYWKELEHCHNFTRARLEVLLVECGFMPVYFGVSERYQAGMEIIAI